MNYYIVYNSKFMTSRKTLKSAIKAVKKRGYTNSGFNYCYIQDEHGNLWTTDGEVIDDYDEWLNNSYNEWLKSI